MQGNNVKPILKLFLCCIYLFTSSYAEEPIDIVNCDGDTVASILQEKRGSDDYITSIRCADSPKFEPSQYIMQAVIVDVIADGDQRFSQLITVPNSQGKSQRLNVLRSDNYADDGQLQGTGTGHYFVEGDKLFVYFYWGAGCKFDQPYEVEKITYKWDANLQQYALQDDIYYTTTEKESRGWECCDHRLLNASDVLTDEEQTLYNQLTTRDGEQQRRLTWGKEAKGLLVETETKLAEQIEIVSQWRQEFCCGYEDDEYLCREQIIKSQDE